MDYKSDVKDAIWELNRILKSMRVLKYIDDPQYPKDIRTALNRGEGYHQLLKSIGDVGDSDFRGMSEMEGLSAFLRGESALINKEKLLYTGVICKF